MRRRSWQWWFAIAMGLLLVAAGIGETVRLTRSGDGGLWFWFPTLVGGGLLILVGTLIGAKRPVPGLVMLLVGCVAGILPTMWTLVVPVLLIVLAVVSAKQVASVTQQQ